jgi:hypothetical protein
VPPSSFRSRAVDRAAHAAARLSPWPPGAGPGGASRLATAALVATIIVLGVLLLPLPALAQEATPTPGILPPTDPRSEGAGPGLDGGPLAAAALVIGLGLIAALATLAYGRLVRR